MKEVIYLVKRNIKVYFSDKAMFFTSLVTPLILLVLYVTFLGNVYKSSFLEFIPETLHVSEKVINSLVNGQLLASLLAVSCITVSFTSNLLMVQDKVNNTDLDFNVSPIKKSKLAISYFIASFISTVIVNLTALIICLIYTYFKGNFYTIKDILLLVLDINLLTLFGISISSVINFYLKTQGQVSAVSSIISAGYGFICGAYMPIYSFSSWLQKTLSFLPGTYATVLIKNHALNPSLKELEKTVPSEAVESIKESVDCTISFMDKNVSISTIYLILIITIIVFITIYILQNKYKKIK